MTLVESWPKSSKAVAFKSRKFSCGERGKRRGEKGKACRVCVCSFLEGTGLLNLSCDGLCHVPNKTASSCQKWRLSARNFECGSQQFLTQKQPVCDCVLPPMQTDTGVINSIWEISCRAGESASWCKPPKSDGSFFYQVIPQVCLHGTVCWRKYPWGESTKTQSLQNQEQNPLSLVQKTHSL